MRLGATKEDIGVTYRVWAPDHENLSVEIRSTNNTSRRFPLKREEGGYHAGHDEKGKAGDRYGYRIGEGGLLPDPASRAQDGDVHGLSIVVDPRKFPWTDANWQRPAYRDLVIYELHVGTFTAEGTFRAAIEKLPHLRMLGVSAIEIMPIGDFPGKRNWGYDGVLIYAPASCYGSPDDLRALVDAAHAEGIAVLLDVVYNHFGPDGNYLSAYSSHFYCKRHHTPWGEGFNLDGKERAAVRDFFLSNPQYWMDEYHIDGFRFDATHEIKDDSPFHILKELAAVVHAQGGYAIAEDARNEALVLEVDGYGFDGVWADDIHHTLRVNQTGENFSYFGDFGGTIQEVAETLRRGWFYSGQVAKNYGGPRGTDGSHLPPASFVCCISNHDQTGNRAFGERINQLVAPSSYRALSVLLCLCPFTPMLFMGQEWNASSPFLFFCDHNEDLGKKITAGRKKEFAAFPEFAGGKSQEVPDPQAESSFIKSKLNWEEMNTPKHMECLRLYQESLALRSAERAFRPKSRTSWSVSLWEDRVIALRHEDKENAFLLLFNPKGEAEITLPPEHGWEVLLSSNAKRFGGTRTEDIHPKQIQFLESETVVLRSLRT